MKKIYMMLLLVLLSAMGSYSQTWTNTFCSSGPPSSTVASTYGPMSSVATANATSRFAYIYPADQLTGLASGALTSIFFHKATTNNMLGTPNFKVYLKEVTAIDWGTTALDWTTAITGATLVFNGDPASIISGSSGWKQFPFTTNFVYSGGANNLAIFTEYVNTTASNAITWSYEFTSPCVNTSNSNTTKYISNTTGTLGASLSSSNFRRPYIGFNFLYPTDCAGTPEAGTISGTLIRPTCGGSAPGTVTATGFSTGANGYSLQWETSTDNSTWVNATGAGNTTAIYTLPNHTGGQTEYYRLKVTCSFSGLSDVSDVTVQVTDPAAPATQASSINTSALGITNATVTWTNGSGSRRYVVVNTTNSFTDPVNGSGAALTANTVYSGSGEQIVYDGTGSSVSVTGLTCNTQYYVRVYEYNRCGTVAPFDYYYNTTTATANPGTFTTGPTTATLPAANNFTGFTGTNLSTVFPGWYEAIGASVPAGTTSGWTSSTSLAGAGTSAKINLFTTTRNEWIISPKVTLTAASRMMFDIAITDFGSGSADPSGMQGTDDKVEVLISTDGCGAVWNVLETFNAANTTGVTNALSSRTIDLSAYTGQSVQLAFKATDGPTDDAPDYDFHIDNINIELVPSCSAPTGLNATSVLASTATLNWAAASPAPVNGYDYYYSTSNTAPTGSTTPSGSTAAGVLSANISSLSANTTYYFWVRSKCAGSDLSTWAGPNSFYTGYCIPVATSSSSFINNFTTTGGTANISNLASGFTTGGYQDNYATMGATIAAGSNLGFSMDITGTTVGAAVWVDLNNNLAFEPGERLFNTTSYSGSPLAGSIAIPGGTSAGEYRMRVLIDWNAQDPTNPCGFASGRGEVEDYKLTVTPQPTDAMDWVNLQWPASATISVGGSETIYTKGYEPGVTEAAGPGAGITVWIGVSPVGAAPSSNPATWTTWVPATFNVQVANDDEFSAAIGSTLAPGTYQYASRWQLNGGPYRYGGYNGGGGGFWDGTTNVSGVLTVLPVANDDCAGAITVNVSADLNCTSLTAGTVLGATPSSVATCTGTADDDVWFKFTATSTVHQVSLLNIIGSNVDMVFQVFDACGGTSLLCSDPQLATLTGLTIGNTYYIRIYTYTATTGQNTSFNLCVAALPPVTNDECASATALTVNANLSCAVNTSATTFGATASTTTPAPTCNASGANDDVWFTFVATGSSHVVSVTGATNTTASQVYSGTDCTNLVAVACASTSSGTLSQTLTGLTPGNTYFVRVYSTSNVVSTTTNFIICVGTPPPPPANDECAGALAINTTVTAGSNVSATQSMAANSTCTSTSSPDVWYSFTATSNGSAIIALTNVVTIDPILEAFTGTCGALTSLGCVDAGSAGANETQTLNSLTAGQVIYVRVSGWNGSMGTFNIAVSGGALPVSIEYFTGTKQAGQNRLDWKINCYNSPSVTMVLQRSADGRNYTDLTTLTETAVRCQSPFNQNDLNPLPGLNYYRLKTIDIDGQISYSNVVALLNQTKGFELVSLAPNPVADKTILSVTSAEKAIMEIVITDISGKQVSKQRVSLIAGNNQIQLNLRNVSAGTYQVSGLTADGEVKTLRFVKQ